MCVANSLITGLPLYRASAVLSVMLNAQSAPLPLSFRSRVAMSNSSSSPVQFPLTTAGSKLPSPPLSLSNRTKLDAVAKAVSSPKQSREPCHDVPLINGAPSASNEGNVNGVKCLIPFFSNLKFELSSWAFLGV